MFSGTYDIILPNFSSQPFKVVCDAGTLGGGWTIILRRMDGSVNFHRNWTEYKNGFGNLNGEFFLGLDKIHEITAERSQELLVLLEDFEGDKAFEKYEEFAIGNEDKQYELHTLGDASGTAGDSFLYHRGSKFSTFDRDNDGQSDKNCAQLFTGAWWYRSNGYCQICQLTGTYGNNDFEKGVNWHRFRGSEYSLKKAVMMIRPKK
ncbi:ficolin-1-like isoform X3 [Drosophila innubila]|uniref:ficolin-1-like isoform X3 n=1 Tax=Drosophila innubila TaxID=198719 RepID=UPI00148C6A53|nr:ficolin-1-like isoform X3 [Drosophila innubila]